MASKSKDGFLELTAIVRQAFSFLEITYGFKLRKKEASGRMRIWYFSNKKCYIKIYEDWLDAYIDVTLYNYSGRKAPIYGSAELSGKFASLDEIVSIRNPGAEILNPYIIYFGEKPNLKHIVFEQRFPGDSYLDLYSRHAKYLESFASDVLNGDFDIVSEAYKLRMERIEAYEKMHPKQYPDQKYPSLLT